MDTTNVAAAATIGVGSRSHSATARVGTSCTRSCTLAWTESAADRACFFTSSFSLSA